MEVQGEILSVLRSKNQCLEQLVNHSTHFLKSAAEGNFAELEAFMKQRFDALRGFELFRKKSVEMLEQIPVDQRTANAMKDVQDALDKKNHLINKIIELDETLMGLISKEKGRIAQELSQTQKSSQSIHKFKSNWISEPGESLDKKL